MAFFPRSFYNSESSFTPLFRLLDDFDNYSRQGTSQQHGRRAGLPSWQPKFDVRETGDNYELHGELAGVDKDQVHIEFTDPQTMLVRGRVERNYCTGTTPAGFEDAPGNQRVIAEGNGEAKPAHRVTVEDDNGDNALSHPRPSKNGGDALAETKTAQKARR